MGVGRKTASGGNGEIMAEEEASGRGTYGAERDGRDREGILKETIKVS